MLDREPFRLVSKGVLDTYLTIYTMYPKASFRFVLDSLHLIKADKIDLNALVEVMNYLHFEGKTKLLLFEKRLAENLKTNLITKKLSI